MASSSSTHSALPGNPGRPARGPRRRPRPRRPRATGPTLLPRIQPADEQEDETVAQPWESRTQRIGVRWLNVGAWKAVRDRHDRSPYAVPPENVGLLLAQCMYEPCFVEIRPLEAYAEDAFLQPPSPQSRGKPAVRCYAVEYRGDPCQHQPHSAECGQNESERYRAPTPECRRPASAFEVTRRSRARHQPLGAEALALVEAVRHRSRGDARHRRRG